MQAVWVSEKIRTFTGKTRTYLLSFRDQLECRSLAFRQTFIFVCTISAFDNKGVGSILFAYTCMYMSRNRFCHDSPFPFDYLVLYLLFPMPVLLNEPHQEKPSFQHMKR